MIVDPQTEGRDTIALWFNVPSASLPDTIKGTITYSSTTRSIACRR